MMHFHEDEKPESRLITLSILLACIIAVILVFLIELFIKFYLLIS